MTDPFAPPSWRVIPPDVKDRIMSTVEPVPARPRSMAMAVAAVVAVFVVGAAFVLQPATTGHDSSAPPSSTASANMDKRLADRLLRRCFPQGNVTAVLTADYGDIQVLGAREAGKPVFCEVTPMVTTISRTVPATSRPSLVLHSPLGTVAGVVNPSVTSLWVKTGATLRPAAVSNGLFVTNGADVPGQPVEADEGWFPQQWTTLPEPTTPPQVIVADEAKPDRTSPRGLELDSCIKAAMTVQGVVDAGSWEPGAQVSAGQEHLIITRNNHGYSACWQLDGKPGFGRPGEFTGYLADRTATGPGPRSLPGPVTVGGNLVILGVVPSSSRVEVVVTDGPTFSADVHGSTFAVLLPAEFELRKIRFRLYDSAGSLTYSGGWNN